MLQSSERLGYRSPKHGNLGVYTLCSGPDPSGPAPGERMIIVIYNKDNCIVRRLEQVKGDCLDEGYIDFFNTFLNRPSVHAYHIVDTDQQGNKQILATHTTPGEANQWLKQNVPLWIGENGIPQ